VVGGGEEWFLQLEGSTEVLEEVDNEDDSGQRGELTKEGEEMAAVVQTLTVTAALRSHDTDMRTRGERGCACAAGEGENGGGGGGRKGALWR
jgi:hypothetical protein